jgi:arylformamidase
VPAAYASSGVHDLSPLLHLAGNADFKLDEAEVRRISPVFWPAPHGRTLDSVVGGLESSEFLRQSKLIVDAWSKGNTMRYEVIPGMNHFTICDPMADPDSAMTARLAELARSMR